MVTLSLHLLLFGVVGSVGDDVVDAFYSSRQIRCFKIHLVGMICSKIVFSDLIRV